MNRAVDEGLAAVREAAGRIGRPIRLMEVCGTHTMAVSRSGLRPMLPRNVALLSGPGCPVCVTPVGYVDRAVALARAPSTVVATFGDMVRVPGSSRTLERARAEGGRVRVVYSALDALDLAAREPGLRVVFLGVGFETTAPGIGWTIREAARRGLANYFVLSGHKVMPPAMEALAASPALRVDGFICPGHVSITIGWGAYEPLARRHGVPCVVAGFEPADVVKAVALLLEAIGDGRAGVQNAYARSVEREGNAAAQAVIREVFEPADAVWRGLGAIPGSGLAIRAAYRAHDAGQLLAELDVPPPAEPAGCRCGDVLRGAIVPPECPLFGARCTPAEPVGACMVSSEGACAAYYRYERRASA